MEFQAAIINCTRRSVAVSVVVVLVCFGGCSRISLSVVVDGQSFSRPV